MASASDDGEAHALRRRFDLLAAGYDSPATRFFPFCADRLVRFVRPKPGTKVLDVATGTGAVAVAFAQAVGAGGRVTGIDFSPAMLDRAEANIRKMALDNVDLHEMDAARLDFRGGYFHSVVCSYGLFFMPDMLQALREWTRVLRPGGMLAFTSFETTAFQPMLDDFVARAASFGISPPAQPAGPARIRSVGHCRELLTAAGLEAVQVETVQLGYHLREAEDWWEVVTRTALGDLLEQLPETDRDMLRRQHLDWVATQKGENGLWMDVQTRFAGARKPS